MACGRPVVASDLPGIRRVVSLCDGGVLARAGDVLLRGSTSSSTTATFGPSWGAEGVSARSSASTPDASDLSSRRRTFGRSDRADPATEPCGYCGYRTPRGTSPSARIHSAAPLRRHEVHVAESLGGSTSVSDYLTRHYLRGLRYARYRDGRIVIHRIPRFSPALHVAPLRRLNTRIFSRYVERLVEHHRIECVVGTFHLPPIDGPRLIFDSFDANAAYWRHLDRAKGYANEIARSTGTCRRPMPSWRRARFSQTRPVHSSLAAPSITFPMVSTCAVSMASIGWLLACS